MNWNLKEVGRPEYALHKAVSKSIRCSGKTVEDARIHTFTEMKCKTNKFFSQ